MLKCLCLFVVSHSPDFHPQDPHPKYPAASSAISIRLSPAFGRQVVATRPISAGEVKTNKFKDKMEYNGIPKTRATSHLSLTSAGAGGGVVWFYALGVNNTEMLLSCINV